MFRSGLSTFFLLLSFFYSDAQQVQVSCGQVYRSSRIVGGETVTSNEFPWAVFLKIESDSNNVLAHCGGTLINEQWILTAAHCLFGASKLTALLGTRNINTLPVAGGQSFVINRNDWHVHPEWYYGQVENDIALLRLSTPITFTDTIRPACLPNAGDFVDANALVTLVGWGNYSVNSGLSPQLRKVDTLVIPSCGNSGTCQYLSGRSFSGSKIICGDGWDGARFCYGDDGGAMNYYDESVGAWFAIGVAWIGDRSDNCQFSGEPNIYARVAFYANWINTVVTGTSAGDTTVTPARTTSNTNEPVTFNCEGKPDGNYPNPGKQCSNVFYMCSNGVPYKFHCGEDGTYYNAATNACDWPYNIAGC